LIGLFYRKHSIEIFQRGLPIKEEIAIVYLGIEGVFHIVLITDLSYNFFYDILKTIAQQFGFDYPEDKLLALAARIKSLVDDKSRYTDWATRGDIKAELKMDLIVVLAEYGYPPVTNDAVFKEILEQAENFKRSQDKAT